MAMSAFYRGLRERVGSDLLLIPAVAALIRDDKGRILIQQGHDESWSLPAGAIEPGETPCQAVVREACEETGLHVRPERVAGVVGGTSCRVRYANGHEVEYVVTVFDCSVVGGDLLESGAETRALAFVEPTDALSRLSFPYPPGVLDATTAGAYFDVALEGASQSASAGSTDIAMARLRAHESCLETPPGKGSFPTKRSARLVILDGARRLLLFRYDDGRRPPFWSTVGGHVEEGEDYVTAAARELREETGFEASIGPLLRERDEVYELGAAPPMRYLEQYFLVLSRGGDPDRSGWTPEERATIRQHRWWSLDEMRSTSDVFRPEWLASLLEEVLPHSGQAQG